MDLRGKKQPYIVLVQSINKPDECLFVSQPDDNDIINVSAPEADTLMKLTELQ